MTPLRTLVRHPLAISCAWVVAFAACSAKDNPITNDTAGGPPADTTAPPAPGEMPGGTSTVPTPPPVSGGAADGFLGDDTADDGAPTGLTDDNACATDSIAAEPLPPVIEVLLDTSGSMNGPIISEIPNGVFETKWQTTQKAFEGAVMALPDSSALGMMFYPYPPMHTGPVAVAGSRDCEITPDAPILFAEATVPIELLSATHRTTITEEMNGVDPNGGTPTHAAYLEALNVLKESELVGSKFLLLVTDGSPTYGLEDKEGELVCVGDGMDPTRVPADPLVDEAAKAAADGIKTFVIGSPGSEDSRNTLSRMASAGGTALAGCNDAGPDYCHFDMTAEADFAEALSTTLEEISGITRGCSYKIPDPPEGQTLDPDRVNVSFTPSAGGPPMEITRDPSMGCNSGWQYSEDGSTIELCSDWCTQTMDDPAGAVEILLGCLTNIGPPARLVPGDTSDE